MGRILVVTVVEPELEPSHHAVSQFSYDAPIHFYLLLFTHRITRNLRVITTTCNGRERKTSLVVRLEAGPLAEVNSRGTSKRWAGV